MIYLGHDFYWTSLFPFTRDFGILYKKMVTSLGQCPFWLTALWICWDSVSNTTCLSCEICIFGGVLIEGQHRKIVLNLSIYIKVYFNTSWKVLKDFCEIILSSLHTQDNCEKSVRYLTVLSTLTASSFYYSFIHWCSHHHMGHVHIHT